MDVEAYEEDIQLDFGVRRGAQAPGDFIAQNPCLRIEEFMAGREREVARKSLEYHVRQGHLVVVRRGTYLWKSMALRPDPFILASRVARGAVISHASALWWHELLPQQETMVVTTRTPIPPLSFAGTTYRTVPPPPALRDADILFTGGVRREERLGVSIDVCTPERAFVDCLHRLDVSPDLEALWQAFNVNFDPPDGAEMVRYAVKLGNRVTCARVGLFIQYRRRMFTREPQLHLLRERMPAAPALADPRYPRYLCQYLPEWRLLLPSGFHRVLFPNG